MTQTVEEKRAYARGYNRGRNRRITWAVTLLRILKGYRARLTDVDTARQCQTCDRWKRGGGPEYRWGYCRADFQTMEEPGLWADDMVGDKEPRRIITHEHFGCVNWIPPLPSQETGG